MNLQEFADKMGAMTCVVSVENLGNGRYGEIRIVAGNRAYVDSIEKPTPGAELLKRKFVPDTVYTEYLTRDINFEEYCYSAAVEKKCLHSYAKPDRLNVCFNMIFLPLEYTEGNKCYCTYTMEIDFAPDVQKMSSVSSDVAARVMDICLRLRNPGDFKESLSVVIEDIREMCKAELCCVLLMDSYERKCDVLCEAFSKDTSLRSMNSYVDDDFYNLAASWESTVIAGSNCLIAKNEQYMDVVKERNPEWYKSLTDAGCKNVVLFPLKFNGELLGYIWAVNFDPDNSVTIKHTLETSCFILGAEINNYLLLDRLKILSSRDMLTGIMNRNEMNNYIAKLSGDEELGDFAVHDREAGAGENSIGVVFVDLNGLKEINDEYGHGEGDRLLKDAAKILKEVFSPEEVFRAGGDEFVVIKCGVSEVELIRKMHTISTKAKEYRNLSFAMGTCYATDKKDVREALKTADYRMYEDKKAYYERHPEKKIR